MTRTRIWKTIGAFVLGGTVAAGAAAFVAQRALGDGVAQVMTSKSLPAATIAVIDPESGISSGGGSTDVKLAPGDVISFRFNYTPVPDKIVHGLQGYLTEFVPPNTQVVGVRYIDASGLTIVPDYPGISVDGCGRPCNGFNSVPSSGGNRNLDDGSIAQLYADTGVFYSTDTRTRRNPGNAFIAFDNGVLMNPAPTSVGSVSGILGTGSPFFAHDSWDYVQVRAFGVSGATSGNNGTGNTPFKYGSPVAGPQTFYSFEASEPSAGTIQLNDVVGPWQRVKYPGSQLGSGVAVTTTGSLLRKNVGTSLGFDLKPANPLPVGTNAVRFAGGEVRVGEARFAEVSLKVLATPIDSVQNKDADCAETFGGDTSAASDTVRAKDNPWGVYLGSPACVFLNLLFDLNVDKTLAHVGDTLTYTLHGKNLSVNPQTNAVPRLRYDSTRVAFVSATGGPTNLATCDDGSGFACLRWPAMTLAPSDEYTFNASFTVGGGGHVTNVAVANYRSTQLPAPGFSTQSISMVKDVAVVRAALTSPQTATAAGTQVTLSGSVSNSGSGAGSYDQLIVVLPAGWTVASGTLKLNNVVLSCAAGCATSTPTFNISSSFNGGESRPLTFKANVPAGTVTGLYPVDLEIWASQTAFGGSFETYFPRAALVPVGQPRSDIPGLTCPINMGDTSISGTSSEAAGTVIHVYFNLVERCTATVAAGGTWTCSGFTGAAFGPLYGGLEVRASATATSELEGSLSAPCYVSSVPACADFVDNDGDGLTDFPADPGCSGPSDNSEADVPVECADGVDNDGDGLVDLNDPGCQAPFDTSEGGPPACADGVDNDGDGLVDLGDPGCSGMFDASELDVPACMDFEDNDGDGLRDYPADPGCHSPNDDSEATEPTVPGDIQARLLIVFDTSGSMNFNTCSSTFTGGDGSSECPGGDVSCAACNVAGCGNGLADDSRLFKVKAGISDVVAAFGEVEYALMRFHERSMPFSCPTAAASLQAGGWQGAGAAPCGGGFGSGDLLVSFSPENQYDLIEWLDGKDNYAGTPPPGMDVELRGSGTTPLGGSLDSALAVLGGVRTGDTAASCRPYRVILVTDGEETCGGDAPGAAASLLAAGIPVNVIGFATPDPTIIANLNAIAAAGGTGSAIFVSDSTALSTAMASIVTETVLVELCNGADDDCDGLIDEDFPGLGSSCNNGRLGACRRTGVTVCTADQLGTSCTAPNVNGTPEVCNGIDDDCNGIVDDGIVCTPCQAQESCNGLDDDCDGQIDEGPIAGVGTSCGINVGACHTGTIQCVSGGLTCVGSTGPTAEVCNNIDDNCDTIVDGFSQECYTFPSGCALGSPSACQGVCRTGVKLCTAGAFGTCDGQGGPSAERCNGLDDDCDGQTDEDFPTVGQPCTNGQVGECLTSGVVACKADGSGTFCTAPPVGTGTEICNGLDDDCDGLVDEGLGAPIGTSCGGGAGCTAGTLQCVGGAVVCTGTSGGTPEICNGVDDNCNGLIDEPPLPDSGAACDDGSPGVPGHGDTGSCAFGHLECENGALVCEGYTGPGTEVCNGVDDDCDGNVDDLAACPNGTDLCHEGDCLAPCMGGEFPCPFGFICQALPEGAFCVPDPCEGVVCQPGFACDHDSGQCRDRCEGVPCAPGQTCADGFCLDCTQLGCAEGERCVPNASNVGVCEADPCFMNHCDPATQFCRDGACLALACEPACTDGFQCVEGTCVEDLCRTVTCGAGQVCDPTTGQCSADPCLQVECAPGMVCNPGNGACVADPCLGHACGTGQVCHIGLDGQAQCSDDRGIDVLATGGGGCSVGGRGGERRGPTSWWLALVLAGGLAGLARRRRRGQAGAGR